MRRRDSHGDLGPLGHTQRDSHSPIALNPRHTALGCLSLAYLSQDIQSSLDSLIREFRSNKGFREGKFIENSSPLMLITAAFDAIYYYKGKDYPLFKKFWEDNRDNVYRILQEKWDVVKTDGLIQGSYDCARKFSYGIFPGMLDYVILTSLFFVDLHIAEDECIPDFYLRLHGEHCTRLLNRVENINGVSFCYDHSWREYGYDLGLSIIMLTLMERERKRDKKRN